MFTDIDKNLLFEDINAINYVSATGIMDGYSDGRFRPDVFVRMFLSHIPYFVVLYFTLSIPFCM